MNSVLKYLINLWNVKTSKKITLKEENFVEIEEEVVKTVEEVKTINKVVEKIENKKMSFLEKLIYEKELKEILEETDYEKKIKNIESTVVLLKKLIENILDNQQEHIKVNTVSQENFSVFKDEVEKEIIKIKKELVNKVVEVEKEDNFVEVEKEIVKAAVEIESIKESESINTEDKTLNYPKIKSVSEVEKELKNIYTKDIDNKIEEIETVKEVVGVSETLETEKLIEVKEVVEKAAETIETKKTINKIIEISYISEEKIVVSTKEELRDIILSIQNNNRELKNFNNKYDYSTITDMSYMFRNCKTLKTIPHLDTSNVTNMSFMFSNCKSIKTIPQLDITSVTNIAAMFYGCTCLDKTIIKNIKEEYYKKLVKLLSSESSDSFKKNNGTWNCSKIKEVLKVDNDLVKRFDREFKTQKEVSNKKTYESKPNKIIIENIKSESINSGLNSKNYVEFISLYKEGKVSLKELIEYCKKLVKEENYPFILDLIMKKNYKDMLNEKDMLVIIKEVGKPTIKYINDSLYKYGNSYEVMVKNMSEKYFKDNERLKVYRDNRVFN